MNVLKLFFVLTALNWAVIAQDTVCVIDTQYVADTETVPALPSLDRAIETDNFVVHYSLTGEHATTNDYAQDVADYAELAYSYGVYEIGFNPPPSDDGFGGTSKYDIAILNFAPGLYGVTVLLPVFYGDGSASYLAVDNSLDELLLKITVAHEFFHGIEIGYSRFESTTIGQRFWFYENCAVQFADMVFEENFYFNYLFQSSNYPLLYDIVNPLSYPEESITGKSVGSGLYQYSGVLWPMFLTQKLNDYGVIKSVWERFAENQGSHLLEDIDYVLNQNYSYSFNEALGDYAVWRYFTGIRAIPGAFYADAYAYPTSKVHTTISSYPVSNLWVTGLLQVGGTKFIKITNGDVFSFSFDGNQEANFVGRIIHDNSPVSGVENAMNFVNGNDVGSTQIVRNESDGIILSFTYLDGLAINTGGDLNVSKIPKSQVYFRNYVNGFYFNDGQFLLNGTTNIGSGSSVLLDFNTNHTVKTLIERFEMPFESLEPSKHLNWNEINSEYLFSHSFTIFPNQGNSQTAEYISLKQGLIRNSYDGHIFSDGAAIKFNDPWYLHSDGSQSGMNNFLSVTSPHSPTGAYNKSSGGVFLNIGQAPEWESPYYSVQNGGFSSVYLSQTGKSHNAYFLGWLANPTSGAEFQYPNGNTSGVVFKTAGTQIHANYKLTEVTGNTSAYSNSGQRHLGRRYDNGDIYNVYESMGYIWLEKSTDNGSTWTLANDAAPVSSGIAKSPSLDFCTGHLLIVYQEKTSSGYLRIKLKLYDMSEDEVIDSAVVMENNNVDFSFDTQPVIADYYSTGRFMVIYRNNMDHDPFYDTGLHYDYGVVAYNYQTYNYYLSGLNSGNDYYINGTDEESLNPDVSTTPTGVQDNIHLIWQQGLESETYSHILYQKIQWNGSGFTFPAQINVSNGCGYTKNYKPSITSITSDDIPRVSWIGYISDEESEMQKSGSTSGTQSVTIYRETVFRALDNPSSWSYGSNVVHANINRLESTPGYAITWAQESGSSYLNKCMRNTNFYSEYTLSTTGSAVELNNAGLFSNMFGYALHTTSAPYYFGKSQYINTLQKEQINSMKAARSGVLYSGNAQFLFSFGDISVDNAQVFFPVIPDTMKIENFEELKQYLVSDPFMLENQSNFIYSVQYRAVDTASCAAVLGESDEVNFRLLLEDSNSGEVLGEYDNVTFTGNDLMKYENISYEVSTVGIGSRLVRLRLIPSATAELEPSLITRVRSAEEQAKGSLKRIQYNGAEPVKEYSLTQNYPNPFNPVTMIEFALPEKSDITLKVYDILGKEITTLASGSYEPGRYTVPFDGSNYASGVYIYKLSYGKGQTMTKKMTLLK